MESLDLLTREEQLSAFSRMCSLAKKAESCDQTMEECRKQIQQLEADKMKHEQPGKVRRTTGFVLGYLFTACIPAAVTLAVTYALNKTEHLIYLLIAVVAVWLDVFRFLYQKTVKDKYKRLSRTAKRINRELETRQQSLQEKIDNTQATRESSLRELNLMYETYDLEPSLRSYAALMQIYRTMSAYPSAPLYEIIRGCKDDAYRAHRAHMREKDMHTNG